MEEQRYREITELISDAVYSFRLEPDGTMSQEWGAETFTKITGYHPHELEWGRWAEILMHPDDVSVMNERFERFNAGQKAISEYRIITKDGQVRWLRDHGQPVWDEQTNRLVRIYGAVQDITEQKEAEATLLAYRDQLEELVEQRTEELRESEARYRMLAYHSTDLISRHSTDGIYLYASPACQRLLGYTPGELVGRSSYEFFHPDDIEKTRQVHAQVLQSTDVMHSQYRILHRDGHVIWFETTGRAIRGPQSGQIVEIIAVSRDITERKRAEEQRRESERRFRMLAENAQDIIFRFRLAPTPGFDYISPSITNIFGYTPEEYYSDYALHTRIIHPDDMSRFEAFQKSPASHREPLVLRLFRKDGREIWVEQRHWPVVDENGTTVAIEGITRDITEYKRTEARLLQQQHALAMLRERERLARELHDSFGQVLGYVNTQTQTIRELIASGRTAEADIHLDRLSAVTQETYADIRGFILGVQTGGTLEYGFFPSVQRYMERYEHIYGIQTSLTISAEMADQSFAPIVETHLVRIIQEALTNVRKHASATHVGITFTMLSEHIRLVIEDDGCGFDPAQRQEASDGTGYGLHSMRERTSEMGGTLQVDSATGAGTRLIIHIPIQSPSSLLVQTMRVLLVDDQPLFLEGMQNMLTARGIAVVDTARNGIEAQEKARLHHPDVILMDVEMPACNGLEATQRIKAELPDIQIVMLTVSAEDDHLFEAIKSGASGYLLKNLDASDFFTLLAGLEQGEVALSPGMAKRMMQEFARRDTVRAKEYPQEPGRETEHPSDETPQPVEADHTSEDSDTDDASDAGELTDLQREILSLVAQEYTYREVGDMVGYSERSIKKFMSQIVATLHLRNRAAAIAYARKHGLI